MSNDTRLSKRNIPRNASLHTSEQVQFATHSRESGACHITLKQPSIVSGSFTFYVLCDGIGISRNT